MLYNRIHLHMFDGAAGGAAGSAGSGGTASNVGDSQGSQPQVVYGKSEEDINNNNQVGSDGSGGTDGVETNGNDVPDLTKEFEDLIKGKYKQQFDERMRKGIQSRFKNQTDYEGQVNQYADAVQPLIQMYGLETGDIEGLKRAIETDDGLIAQKANEEGLTAERYRHQLKLEAEAARGRAVEEAIKEERVRQETYDRWESEAAALQEAVPSFDLATEIQQTEGFGEYLDMGLSVDEAFFLAHRADIFNGAAQQASQQAQAQTIDNLKSRAARPTENGLHQQPSIVRKTDPSKFTKDDVFKVAELARKGQKISF